MPITNQVEGDAADESRRYLVGPMIEVVLPHGIGFEFDALYSRFGYSSSLGNFAFYNSIRVRANSWEFPLLAKYRFHAGPVHPFALVGYVPRTVSGKDSEAGYIVHIDTGNRDYGSSTTSTNYDTGQGLTAGGGIEIRAGRIHIAPEVRYIHWSHPLFYDYGPQGYFVQTRQSEVEFLVGLTWR